MLSLIIRNNNNLQLCVIAYLSTGVMHVPEHLTFGVFSFRNGIYLFYAF